MTDFRASAESVPVTGIDQLVAGFHEAGKPRERWMIGAEYEKVAVDRATGRAAPFSGARGIEALLRGLAERFGWTPATEDGRTVALAREGASITLEPGAQLELSGAQFRTLHEAERELATHVREILSVGDELGLAFLGLGMQPISRVEEIEWVPKRRYAIMAPYMTRVGRLGHRMMKQTATVQANIDYADERDAMRKLRVGMGIAPLVNAIFANSPVSDGELNGFRSFRGHVWMDTDPARCGLLPFVFRDGAGFAEYVEWALDVPVYFLLRDGRYVTDVTGTPFRRLLASGPPTTSSSAGRSRTRPPSTTRWSAAPSPRAAGAWRCSSTRASCSRSPARGCGASTRSTSAARTSGRTSSASRRSWRRAGRRPTWSRRRGHGNGTRSAGSSG